MAIKLVDELKAMGNFPIAHAEGINLVKTDGTEDNLQNLFDNGELIGGGGDSSVTLTQQEYEALSEEQKLGGLYYTYDTKRIYKNGVQYGASDAEGIGYNNAESGIQATTVQGAIDKVVKTVEDNYAKKTDIPTTLPANGGNADTVNNHTVKSDVPENAVFTDTVYDDTEVKGSIKELNSNLDEKVDYKVVVEDGTRYVEDIVTQDINTWLPNDNSSILINLKKANGANYSNFQLLCNKQDSKNWTCIVIGGISTFWRICYVNGVRYIDELATMDKLGGCSIKKGTTVLTTNQSGAMNLQHGGNFDHCTVSIQPTNNSPYFFSYCPLSKNNTYIIVTNWKGEIVTNTEIEFDWTVIGW